MALPRSFMEGEEVYYFKPANLVSAGVAALQAQWHEGTMAGWHLTDASCFMYVVRHADGTKARYGTAHVKERFQGQLAAPPFANAKASWNQWR